MVVVGFASVAMLLAAVGLLVRLVLREIRLVQDVTTSSGLDRNSAGIAALFSSALEDAGAVTDRHIDQTRAFSIRHEQLVARIPGAPDVVAEPKPQARRIKRQILDWNLRSAFHNLSAWQNELATYPVTSRGDLVDYASLAYVMAGSVGPDALELVRPWQRL